MKHLLQLAALFCLLISCGRMDEVPAIDSPISDMEKEACIAVLHELNMSTGSKGVVNKSDIPVIIKKIKEFADSSPRNFEIVNDIYVTDILLHSLSEKYKETPAHMAALLNTQGARRWLWRYIVERGDLQSYEAIQYIWSFAESIKAEAQAIGIDFDYSVAKKGWPEPNPFYYQTVQGLGLYIDTGVSHLASPFGKIEVYSGGSTSYYAIHSISEAFIKRLGCKLRLAPVSSRQSMFYKGDEGTVHEVEPGIPKGENIRVVSKYHLREISREAAEARVGSNYLLYNSYCGISSVYNVTKFETGDAPELIWPKKGEDKRSHELIKRVWELLELNHKGIDPIANELKPKWITEAKTVSPPVEKPPVAHSLQDVAKWAVGFARQLDEQELFPEKTWLSCDIKLIQTETYGIARGVEILNNVASHFLPKGQKWQIHTFGCGNNRMSLKGEDLGDGLTLWLYKEKDTKCDLETLEKAYLQVLELVVQGWERAWLRDYPDILHTESEETHYLLVRKDRSLKEERMLIGDIAYLMGVGKYVHGGESWKSSLLSNDKPVYLWIQKDKYEEVVKTLGLVIQ